MKIKYNLFWFFAIMIVVFSCVLVACNNDEKESEDINYSEGLSYSLNEKGNGYIVDGIGTFDGVDLVIPSEYDNLLVTSIGDRAFRNCNKLKSVTIPDSVIKIGSSAFAFCDSLTSITIPDSVTYIDDWAFARCVKLESAIIGKNVSSIGDYAFVGCINLTSLIIGSNVTMIGGNAFRGCGGLTNLSLPNKLVRIGAYAFAECSGLTHVTIPKNVNGIGAGSFYYCTELTNITFEDTTTWYMTTDSADWIHKTDGEPANMTDTLNNATYLTTVDYNECYWYKL